MFCLQKEKEKQTPHIEFCHFCLNKLLKQSHCCFNGVIVAAPVQCITPNRFPSSLCVFLSQCGGGHGPEGGVFPAGGERHVHPDGPAGHRAGQIDVLFLETKSLATPAFSPLSLNLRISPFPLL